MKFRKFFTLIELLVVIAVIAILAAMLLPALKKAKDKSFEARCKSQQSQCGLAFISYANDWNGWIPAVYWNTVYWDWWGGSGWTTTSTCNWVTKFIEMGQLPKPISAVFPPVSICPSLDKTTTNYPVYAMNSYLGLKPDSTGVDAPQNIFRLKNNSRNILIADGVTDSNGNILSVPEITGPYHNAYISMRHNGGSNILYIDGHVQWKAWISTLETATYTVQ